MLKTVKLKKILSQAPTLLIHYLHRKMNQSSQSLKDNTANLLKL
jgi:hypothetical protein